MTAKIPLEHGWVLGTGHFPREDAVRLSALMGQDLLAREPAARDFGCLHMAAYGEGYIFTFWTTQECLDDDDVNVYKEFATENGLSDALLKIILDAVNAGCRYLRFDADVTSTTTYRSSSGDMPLQLSSRPHKDVREVRRYLDGKVEVIWSDGVRRTYSKDGYERRITKDTRQ